MSVLLTLVTREVEGSVLTASMDLLVSVQT